MEQVPQWSLAGGQGYDPVETTGMRVFDLYECANGCTLAEAFSNQLLWDSFYRFTGTSYVKIGGFANQGSAAVTSTTWHPWDGFWSAALAAAVGNEVNLLIVPDN